MPKRKWILEIERNGSWELIRGPFGSIDYAEYLKRALRWMGKLRIGQQP